MADERVKAAAAGALAEVERMLKEVGLPALQTFGPYSAGNYRIIAAALSAADAVSAGKVLPDDAEPVAVRYGWDGHGYQYADDGSGSDWMTRHKDAEPLYRMPPFRDPRSIFNVLDPARDAVLSAVQLAAPDDLGQEDIEDIAGTVLATLDEMCRTSPSIPLLTEEEVRADERAKERERCAKIAENGLLPCDMGGDLILDSYTADTIAACVTASSSISEARRHDGPAFIVDENGKKGWIVP